MSIVFETEPDRYRHWKLTIEAPVAWLTMDVTEDAGLSSEYQLKLNSYDLGVDIELNDAIQRLRFEHPEVRSVVMTSAKDRIFCAGANIYMLGRSEHGFKVNFCKYTNETRLAMEDASENSGIKFLCAVTGTCAGGGYELALACDEIYLIDDGNSAVSLPEVPLLGVLPGTGGLTRVVDKRMVRRDRADFFSTLAEGIRGKRAVEWGLVDASIPRSKFDEAVKTRATELAAMSDRPVDAKGIKLSPLNPKFDEDGISMPWVTVALNRDKRTAELIMRAPQTDPPSGADHLVEEPESNWALQAFRQLELALHHVRLNENEIGTLVIRAEGDQQKTVAWDEFILANQDHWLVRETLHFMKRTLKKVDLTAKSLFALIEPGSCFAGSLFELALASDRTYMLDDLDEPNEIRLSGMNAGPLPMGNGISRLETRFLGDPKQVEEILANRDAIDAQTALAAGLVLFAPDDIDYEDEVRLALEERSSLSPDSLTGMEANLRFAGPETMETKIFGRLTAWQNWIFQRPNAVGEKGALTVYGTPGARPEFDWRRT